MDLINRTTSCKKQTMKKNKRECFFLKKYIRGELRSEGKVQALVVRQNFIKFRKVMRFSAIQKQWGNYLALDKNK